MTKKETIYNALGMIEGAVCVSQKNTRDVLMKAIQMIKDAIEEDAELECDCNNKLSCVHEWECKEVLEYPRNDIGIPNRRALYVCRYCGAKEMRDV